MPLIVAKVTPIPKGGDLRNVKNWRPISVLPLPGRLMEKICTKFILNELTVNNILSDFQFGFRKGLLTSHAIFHFVRQIAEGINNEKLTAAVYLDFARAFDSVIYIILESKLRCVGISNTLRRWVRGYLKNRKICTKFNGVVSGLEKLSCGVPQRSVIGPIFFICYINDIVEVAYKNHLHVTLYANDAVLYCTSENSVLLKNRLQNALDDTLLWCKTNHINLNIGETKLCRYGSRAVLNNNKSC